MYLSVSASRPQFGGEIFSVEAQDVRLAACMHIGASASRPQSGGEISSVEAQAFRPAKSSH